MTQLSDFSPEEAETLVSLLWRVGMHISFAEDEDGEQDDAQETAALESCIAEIARVHDGPALTREIAEEVLNLRDKWPSWSEGVFTIAPHCRRAVSILKSRSDDDEMRDYIKTVLEIAAAVAGAYGEFGEDPAPEQGFLGKAVCRIIGRFSGMSAQDSGHPMNISAAEDSAISAVAAALRTDA